MYRNFLSVGGFTALSRLTGFARDLMIGAVMGVGPLADAFVVALRLPNQFRAIFGEGAFNSAYVPTYSRVLIAEGEDRATLFASRILTLLAAKDPDDVIALGLSFVIEIGPGTGDTRPVVDSIRPSATRSRRTASMRSSPTSFAHERNSWRVMSASRRAARSRPRN